MVIRSRRCRNAGMTRSGLEEVATAAHTPTPDSSGLRSACQSDEGSSSSAPSLVYGVIMGNSSGGRNYASVGKDICRH